MASAEIIGQPFCIPIEANVLDYLRSLPDNYVHLAVTSPPYWGLRSYSGEQIQIWPSDQPLCDECSLEAAPVPSTKMMTQGCTEMRKHPRLVESCRDVSYARATKKSDNPASTLTGGKRSISRLMESITSRPNQSGGATEKQSTNQGSFAVDYSNRVVVSAFCRDCGAWHGPLGMEPSVDLFIDHLVMIFEEVRRVLRPDGSFWVNIGDSFNGSGGAGGDYKEGGLRDGQPKYYLKLDTTLKKKDLCLVPERLGIALQRAGWWIRSRITWCLSGGTWLYVKSQKGVMPMMIKDMVRLDPSTIQLWNGKKWTRVLGWSEADSKEDAIELELRSGERIGCTPHHKWPTKRGGIEASDLRVGDVIKTCDLPDVDRKQLHGINAKDPWLGLLPSPHIGQFVGYYLADGSLSGDTIQIATHIKKKERIEWLTRFASYFGVEAHFYKTKENGGTVNITSKILKAIIQTYLAGNDAKTKHLTTAAWQRDNRFLSQLFLAYLYSDGSFDIDNNRHRLGFTRNYALARDLRTMGARLGHRVRIKPSKSTNTVTGKTHDSFKGEVRLGDDLRHGMTDNGEIITIEKSRARRFWHIGVEDKSGLFSLASGILTHNSKANSMPEDPPDRPNCCEERIWLCTKRASYYYDKYGFREPLAEKTLTHRGGGGIGKLSSQDATGKVASGSWAQSGYVRRPGGIAVGGVKRAGGQNPKYSGKPYYPEDHLDRNLRNVWHINPKPSNWDYCIACDLFFEGGERKPIRIGGKKNHPGKQLQLVTDAKYTKIIVWEIGVWDFETEDFKIDPKTDDILLREVRVCPGCESEEDWVGHFAQFPPELPERCIKLGTSEHGCCLDCGTPYRRLVDKTYQNPVERDQEAQDEGWIGMGKANKKGSINSGDFPIGAMFETIGWEQGCSCPNSQVVPAIVMDPFLGAATTGLVAENLRRVWLGCDLSADYCRVAEHRLARDRASRGGKIIPPRQTNIFEFEPKGDEENESTGRRN